MTKHSAAGAADTAGGAPLGAAHRPSETTSTTPAPVGTASGAAPSATAPSPAAPSSGAPASRTAGSQTLARGLEALRAVAGAQDGLTVADIAGELGVHRTIAYRILNTLSDARLVHRGADGRFRGAAGLLALASAAHQGLRAAALPVLRESAEALGASVALIVREGADAVALAVMAPSTGAYHVSFSEGSRHPLERGAAGHAIMASGPAVPGEAEPVIRAREAGFAETFGEVEPRMYGVAVPIPERSAGIPACLNVICVREDIALSSVAPLKEAVADIVRRLG